MKKIAISALCLALCAALSASAFALEEGAPKGEDGAKFEQIIAAHHIVYDGEYIRVDAGLTNEKLNSACVAQLLGDSTEAFYFMKDDNGNPVLETTLIKTGMLIENEAEFMAMVVVRGDVTGDGLVDNLDAARVLRYDAGLIPPYVELLPQPVDAPPVDYDPKAARVSLYVEAAGDLTADTEVDNLDAALVLQYDAGLSEGF